MLHQALNFLLRDIRVDLSYPLRLPAQIATLCITTVLFFFMGKIIHPQEQLLQPYGGDYFAFVLLGLALTDILLVIVSSMGEEIRKGQTLGTIEALLITPVSPSAILLYSSLYPFAFSCFRALFYLGLGTLFGAVFHWTHPFLIVALVLLTLLSFLGIGLFSATFVLLLKQNSPVSWAIGSLASLFGGVMYPTEVLPGWLQWISQILPITHSLRGLRQLMLNGAGVDAIRWELLILCGFAVLCLTGGLVSFHYGLQIARRQGSLLHY
ncbi:ABC transporter permease [Desulfogranum japonicum]|uniref:ABC transporter permease n=1 Tax=Desulfogranum japonicum TaxID=231447 RepID=UPI0004241AB9|nr:ABC transporter permease [Desulfogranum japonicum]